MIRVTDMHKRHYTWDMFMKMHMHRMNTSVVRTLPINAHCVMLQAKYSESENPYWAKTAQFLST